MIANRVWRNCHLSFSSRCILQAQRKSYSDGHKLDEKVENALASQVGSNAELNNDFAKDIYPINVDVAMDQGLRSARPRIDPRLTSVILFPGQGAQHVGMGENVIESPNVPELFHVAKKILGYDLLELCLNGPKSQLDRTEYCQPAMLVSSLAAVERLRATNPSAVANCVAAVGFSVGEFPALVFSGALTFEDALRLVKLRAEAMQAASELVPSGLMTIVYGADGRVKLACSAAAEWCIRKGVYEEHAVCSVSNFLFPHCKVIGGHNEALKFIESNAADFGIKKCRRLPVSGAFHTRLMKPAENVFKEALNKVPMSLPLIPVYSNVDGLPYKTVSQVREKLAKQICAPVKFEQTMHTVFERAQDAKFPFTFECGPGNSMLGMLKRINDKAGRYSSNIKA
ncbi:putative malonyl-CoA-acyl carrier protein transacylase, mitochondrial [Halotydeus destructor]|nr:putative malonyl-CoA-acyl carrier protein transacylase, mitochondrial [Halotydeus destructor]